MSVIKVVCPACDGTGAGSTPLPGPTCAAGMCAQCRATGEVTPEKRERLLARAAATEAGGDAR